MSRNRRGVRGAAAGFALAAAGMIYSRLGGRREQPEPGPAAPDEPQDAPVSSDEVRRARDELAAELGRRSQR